MAASVGESWLDDLLKKPVNPSHLSDIHRSMADDQPGRPTQPADAVTAAALESRRMVELMLGSTAAPDHDSRRMAELLFASSTTPRHFPGNGAASAPPACNLLHTPLDLLGSSSTSRFASSVSATSTAAPPSSSFPFSALFSAAAPPCTSPFSDAAPPFFPAPPAVHNEHQSADIELETESPLPCGWEKCLDLKTGNIYYLNRNTGLTLPSRSRKSYLSHNSSSILDMEKSWSPSPTTSELTVEASTEALNSSAMDKNLETLGEYAAAGHGEESGGDEGALDLNLSLHVGRSPSKPKKKAMCTTQPFLRNSNTAHVASSSSMTSSPSASSFSIARKSENDAVQKPVMQSLKSSHLFKEKQRSAMDERRTRNLCAMETTHCSMVTVACANCLMFVMLSRENPKCPRCGICPDYLESIHDQPVLKKPKLDFSF